MKIELNHYYNNRESTSTFSATIKSGKIYLEEIQNKKLPEFAYLNLPSNSKHILHIQDYDISDLLDFELSKDVNTHFKVNYFNHNLNVYTKLSWIQKQRLKFILNDHFLQRDGNFKWIISAIVSSIFTVCVTYYFSNQSKEVESLKKNNLNLIDSLNKYQNLFNNNPQ